MDAETRQWAWGVVRDYLEDERAKAQAALAKAEDALARKDTELEKLRARLDALDGPHVLVLTDDRWTTEHSLECRESGQMAGCPVHTRVADWVDRVGRPELPNGRYVIGEGALPAALASTPEES